MSFSPLRARTLLSAAAVVFLAACSVDAPSPTGVSTPPESGPAFYTYPAAIYLGHTALGTPTDANPANDVILSKRTHTLSYNCAEGGPNWVSYNLNKTHFGDAPRASSFYTDATLPTGCYRVTTSDYTNGGYDRGHMVRSEERTWSVEDNKATFLMTNVLPQTHDMNGGPWAKFETYLQGLAQSSNKEIYVIAGGTGNRGTLKGEGKVVIPTYTWKVAVIMPYGQGLANITSNTSIEVIAVDMPNVTGIISNPWTSYRTTVDNIERYSGYNLLDLLPDAIETYWDAR
jgi:DNA/RNA endonuclease G (NUC1)